MEQRGKLISEATYALEQCCIVFPNPTTGKINLKYVIEDPSEIEIWFLDLSGKVLFHFLKDGSEIISLNGNHLAEGLYLIKTKNGKGKVFIQRIAIAR